MSVRFAWCKSVFKSWIYLLIFYLIDMSYIDSGVLKSPTTIVWASKSLCRSFRTCFMYLGAPVLGVYIYIGSLALLVSLILLPLCNALLSLLIFVGLKSILSETRIAAPAFFFTLHLHGK